MMATERTANTEDVIDLRDLTDRVEELEDERDGYEAEQDDHGEDRGRPWNEEHPEDAEELQTLAALLEELRGYGGDHQWRGDWYPGSMIRGTYFREYAEELAEDIGAIDRDASWPMNRIDWNAAAEDLKMDYGSVEYDGVEYWYR